MWGGHRAVAKSEQLKDETTERNSNVFGLPSFFIIYCYVYSSLHEDKTQNEIDLYTF